MSDSPTDISEYDAMITRVRGGDDAAVTELVERYEAAIRRSVRAFLGPLLRPYVDSTDIAQSIYVALVAGLREDKFDVSQPEQLVALATKMAKRRVADHWRRHARREKLLSDGVARGDLTALMQSATGPEDDPARILDRAERVERMLEELEDLDRRALELRLLGHSTADAAHALGVADNLLRARLSRLRQRLRDSDLWSDWL